jgi:hypothetical protein
MATFGGMIDEVKQNLNGYTLNQERISYLNSQINDIDTIISLGDTANLVKGIIEIDDELMYATSFDKNQGTLSIAPGFGRGYQGTTAASHAQYAQVIVNPMFPRNAIKRAINDTIETCGLDVVATHTFSYSPARVTYALPDATKDVLMVSYSTIGASQEWAPIRAWRHDKSANVAAFSSSQSISLYSGVEPGRTVQVTYLKDPNPLVSNSDDFSTVTGLENSARDMIIWGACYRLASYIDAGRMNLTSAEADLANTKIPLTAGTAAARYFYANYQQRLAEEKARLQKNKPIRTHYTR